MFTAEANVMLFRDTVIHTYCNFRVQLTMHRSKASCFLFTYCYKDTGLNPLKLFI